MTACSCLSPPPFPRGLHPLPPPTACPQSSSCWSCPGRPPPRAAVACVGPETWHQSITGDHQPSHRPLPAPAVQLPAEPQTHRQVCPPGPPRTSAWAQRGGAGCPRALGAFSSPAPPTSLVLSPPSPQASSPLPLPGSEQPCSPSLAPTPRPQTPGGRRPLLGDPPLPSGTCCRSNGNPSFVCGDLRWGGGWTGGDGRPKFPPCPSPILDAWGWGSRAG